MRKLFGTLIIGLLALLTLPAHAGELKHGSIYSDNLKRDLPFLVYLPDGYNTGQYRYPVLYLLHGAGQDERAWATHGLIREKVDQLTDTGMVRPTVIVMPGCPRCWWIDGPKDKAETAFWHELVPAIAARYRTIETREGMLIAGLSAGGYGTIRFAMRYPARIAAIAAFSPAIYSEAPPPKSGARVHPAFLDPAGRFDQQAWERRNYPALIEGYFAQPIRVPMYLASGDNDRLGTAFETALLFKRMYQRQPRQVELRVVDGGHNWTVWATVIDEAMRFMYRHASRPIPDVKDPGPGTVGNDTQDRQFALSRAGSSNLSIWQKPNKPPLSYTPIGTQSR